MERKLVRQGRNALTVTIPAKWAQQLKLIAGDAVYITQNNAQLIITTHRTTPSQHITLDVRNFRDTMTYHKILAAYIDGYDTIEVLHNNDKSLLVANDKMTGFVIEELTQTKAVFKNIVAVPQGTIDKHMRRLGHMIQQQCNLLIDCAQHKAVVKDVRHAELLHDQHVYFCMRFINKYEQSVTAYRYFLLCATFEAICDRITTIAKHIGSDVDTAKAIAVAVNLYAQEIYAHRFERAYGHLRKFRASIGKDTYLDGLVFSLAELLYNNLGYVVSDGEKKKEPTP